MPRLPVRIAALGDRDPSYLTHREIDAALALVGPEFECVWLATDAPAARDLDAVDGVWLLPGTPYRDDEAAYRAIRHCAAAGTPFLGTCGGFQYACVELARSLAGVSFAAHAESDPAGEDW
jgi:CTP synthase (UTP-ammonia lyase)